MMEDDDFFLIIVGEESRGDQIPAPIQIKQECLEEDEIIRVEDIIERAEKHGKYINIESEEVYLDGDETQFESDPKTRNEEVDPDEIDEDYTNFEDIEYITEAIDETDDVNEAESTQEEQSCEIDVPSYKPKSFVQELREQYRELRDNNKLLVQTLCEIMRNVRRPPLPDGHFVSHAEGLQCPKCGHLSDTIPAAGRHFQEKHGPRYLMCYSCGVDFRSTTNLYKHEKRCPGRDRRVVLMSRAACLGNKGRGRPYLQHRVAPPPPVTHRQYSCSECSAVFNNKNNMQSHEYLHRGERPFQCDQCPAAYTSYSALVRHAAKHSNIEFICDHCQRPFKLKAALVAHMDIHRPLRKFGCELCDRRFAQKQALQLHVDRVHRNLPPPHACQICPKRYPRMSLLKTHMKNQHGLAIMTRKMFFKKLPMLSDAEMKQAAKIVFKTNTPQPNYLSQPDNNVDFMDRMNEEDIKQEPECILPDNPDEQDIVNYFRQFTEQNGSTDGANTFIINGEVVQIQIEESYD